MNNKRWDAVWKNCSIATMAEGKIDYGLIHHAAIAVKDGKIAWVGELQEIESSLQALTLEVYDVGGRCITPGLIDCHTHLVYAGERLTEFESRMKGKSYAEIGREGGGILATVAATRLASEKALLQQSLPRARALAAEGVTMLEIKSGYGLDLMTELKMLRVAKSIDLYLPIHIKTTFLGAHTVPLEFAGRADDYIDFVCQTMMPAIAELSTDFVDVFCEKISFDLKQTERIFRAAKIHHLAIKCHAEQLSHTGAAALAAQYGALSVDHLEFITARDVPLLQSAGTVAVLLPGAYYFLREKQRPPVEILRSHQIPMALATDCNPGTSPITSLLLILNMACVLFGFTPEEALLGVTRHAAKALGMQHSHGSLVVGKAADFVVWDIEHPAELTYKIGLNPLYQRIIGGQG